MWKRWAQLVEANHEYVITLVYELREESSDPGPGPGPDPTTRYDLVVKYLEEGTEEVLASEYSTRKAEGSSYDVTAQTEKTISGYTVTDITGDDVIGNMNSDKEIIVWYVRGDGHRSRSHAPRSHPPATTSTSSTTRRLWTTAAVSLPATATK